MSGGGGVWGEWCVRIGDSREDLRVDVVDPNVLVLHQQLAFLWFWDG